ncbi:unnamed protein product [Linum trigynum]|uniref:Uncharacterized protein n=1 Tax=Linum trigynum TaxID=586398 RepID=A0AAV2ESH4_9ROSI
MRRSSMLGCLFVGCGSRFYSSHRLPPLSSREPYCSLLFFHPNNSTLSSNFCSLRRFSSYAVEQFSDDEYECDFESHKASSSVANIDEWKWKMSLLLRSETDQEIVSKDRKDRRDYEQISNLAQRMGLYRWLFL